MPTDPNLEHLFISVAVAVAALLVIRTLSRLQSGIPFVSPQTVQQALTSAVSDCLILDVRQPAEFNDALGHIKGAINIPLGDIPARLTDVCAQLQNHAHVPVYVVCRSGARAMTAAKMLKKAGLENVAVMSGGMVRWKRAGLATA